MVGLVSPLSVPFPFPSFPFLSFPLRSSSPFFRCLLAQEATALEWSANASEATAATADPSGALGNPETRNISSKSAGRLRSCGVGACLCRWALSRRGVEVGHGRNLLLFSSSALLMFLLFSCSPLRIFGIQFSHHLIISSGGRRERRPIPYTLPHLPIARPWRLLLIPFLANVNLASLDM